MILSFIKVMILGRDKYNLKVVGTDEAGRGCLAGPVVAAAVILPNSFSSKLIYDSKKLSPKARKIARAEIVDAAEKYAIVAVGPKRIDKLNILQASLLAMKLACERVGGDFYLVDGIFRFCSKEAQECVIGGDGIYYEIAAASILAKVYRDELMQKIHKRFPNYGFATHMGYPTVKHRHALKAYGSTACHRLSFRLEY
jgi:ribonuclease HII